MAEGYVFTSATDVNDLLNQIISQAAVHGWTQNELSTFSSAGRRGHISKDGVTLNFCSMPGPNAETGYVNTILNTIIPPADQFQSSGSYQWRYSLGTIPTNTFYCPDVICINAGTGYSGGSPWYRQPGADVMAAANNRGRFSVLRAKGAIGKVHMFFFDNPSAIFVFAEVRAGEWYWLAGGNLQKDYEYAGGQFYGASMRDNDIISEAPFSFSAMEHRVTDAGVVVTRGNGWGSVYQSAPDTKAFSGWYQVPQGRWLPGYYMAHYNSTLANEDDTSQVQLRGYDGATGRLWVQPPYAYAGRVDGGSSYLGVLPHVHFSTTEAFVGGEVVSIGGIEYMILPFNWRMSPWDKDTYAAAATSLCWTRNNHNGAGIAVRKPA